MSNTPPPGEVEHFFAWAVRRPGGVIVLDETHLFHNVLMADSVARLRAARRAHRAQFRRRARAYRRSVRNGSGPRRRRHGRI